MGVFAHSMKKIVEILTSLEQKVLIFSVRVHLVLA